MHIMLIGVFGWQVVSNSTSMSVDVDWGRTHRSGSRLSSNASVRHFAHQVR